MTRESPFGGPQRSSRAGAGLLEWRIQPIAEPSALPLEPGQSLPQVFESGTAAAASVAGKLRHNRPHFALPERSATGQPYAESAPLGDATQFGRRPERTHIPATSVASKDRNPLPQLRRPAGRRQEASPRRERQSGRPYRRSLHQSNTRTRETYPGRVHQSQEPTIAQHGRSLRRRSRRRRLPREHPKYGEPVGSTTTTTTTRSDVSGARLPRQNHG